MSDADPHGNLEPADEPDVPDWEDEYLDRVAGRLVFNYDLEKDRSVRGEAFDLYGRLELTSQKHFLHPALSYARHDSFEHLFARRTDRVSVADLERLVALGHDLADDWIEADERHFSTEFVFVLVVPEVPEDVREFVAEFGDRTLLKYGYNGHYDVGLVVVAPDDERLVASPNAGVAEAFRLWDPVETEEPGLFGRIARRLRT